MKKIILLLVLMLTGMSAKMYADAIIEFEKVAIDLGTFKKDTPQKAVFVFKNTGDKPLVIHQAFASCGCTVPTYTKTPIEPGKQGQVVVTYDGRSQFSGHFKKLVSVRSNAQNAMIRLYIEGTTQDK